MRAIVTALFACAFAARIFAADPIAAFSLTDVSYTSPRRNNPVSPRDYLLQVSGWYFGEAT